jgi:hypothetical protein
VQRVENGLKEKNRGGYCKRGVERLVAELSSTLPGAAAPRGDHLLKWSNAILRQNVSEEWGTGGGRLRC